jgi:hypothetical protein
MRAIRVPVEFGVDAGALIGDFAATSAGGVATSAFMARQYVGDG